MDAVMKKVKMVMGKMGGRFLEEMSECIFIACLVSRWLGIMWLVEGKAEGEGGTFCWGVKVNGDMNSGMILGGEEGLECEVLKDGTWLEHVSEFKYFGCVLDKSGANFAGFVGRSLVNARCM